FTAWIFSFEENLAIKNAPPIVRLCLTIGVHFIAGGLLFLFSNYKINMIRKVKDITFYPALTGSKTPTSKFSWSKEVRWEINCP
ncbi:hypothetical protein CBR58_32985, partial [Bacillus thuringiensis]